MQLNSGGISVGRAAECSDLLKSHANVYPSKNRDPKNCDTVKRTIDQYKMLHSALTQKS